MIAQMKSIYDTASAISTNNWADIFYYIMSSVVKSSDRATECPDSTKSEQLATRLNKFSGLFDMAFTIGYAFWQ